MSMSDCPRCWETPCICGYEYKNYSSNKKLKLIYAVLNIKDEESRNSLKKVLLELNLIRINMKEK